jgi:F-type H+-transporting ATPase subunit gamma
MPGISKAIKNRIKSVGSTKKITKAMELVAAAKMRKAIISSLSSRFYAKHAWDLLKNLAKEEHLKHPLLINVKTEKELLIVISSNRGLCGGYNVNIAKTTIQYILKNKNKKIDLIIVGRKGEIIGRKMKNKIIASFVEFSDDLKIKEISSLTQLVISEFTKKQYHKISVIYTDFISSIKYEPKIKILLPINKEIFIDVIDEKIIEKEIKVKKAKPLIIFEPNEESVLDLILPRLTEVQIYQALLEANASEHSARMLAMKNASDNAENMIKELMLYYNQARQSGITQEIAEISSGAQSLIDI